MLPLDKRLIDLILGLVFLVFAACTPQSGSLPNTGDRQTPEAPNSLAHTKWTLVSFGQPGAETPIIAGATITLEFDGQGQVSGSGGCNSYSAPYELQGDKLSFGQITRTLKACQPEGINQQELAYFQALEAASKFELNGDHLTIGYADGQGGLNWLKSTGSLP